MPQKKSSLLSLLSPRKWVLRLKVWSKDPKSARQPREKSCRPRAAGTQPRQGAGQRTFLISPHQSPPWALSFFVFAISFPIMASFAITEIHFRWLLCDTETIETPPPEKIKIASIEKRMTAKKHRSFRELVLCTCCVFIHNKEFIVTL
jgi:hypothetical protein